MTNKEAWLKEEKTDFWYSIIKHLYFVEKTEHNIWTLILFGGGNGTVGYKMMAGMITKMLRDSDLPFTGDGIIQLVGKFHNERYKEALREIGESMSSNDEDEVERKIGDFTPYGLSWGKQ